jgi:hypothetical protein
MERGLTAGFGPAAAVVLDPWPQLVAQLFERREQGDAASVQRAQVAVDGVELDEEGVAVGLAPDPLVRVQIGGHPVREEAGRSVPSDPIVGMRTHRRAPSGVGTDGRRESERCRKSAARV